MMPVARRLKVRRKINLPATSKLGWQKHMAADWKQSAAHFLTLGAGIVSGREGGRAEALKREQSRKHRNCAANNIR